MYIYTVYFCFTYTVNIRISTYIHIYVLHIIIFIKLKSWETLIILNFESKLWTQTEVVNISNLCKRMFHKYAFSNCYVYYIDF